MSANKTTAGQKEGAGPAITEFMRGAGGACGRSFKCEGFTVNIPPHYDRDAEAAEFTRRLSTALEDLATAQQRIAALEVRVPPPSPVRLLGPGCVRFDKKGRPWLLNKRETGWASFGYVLDDWDDLFRRYNVKVVRLGADKDGPWWEVQNIDPVGEAAP